ncbi:MAG: ECF-type sigma factor [Pseudomonadota bacterium]
MSETDADRVSGYEPEERRIAEGLVEDAYEALLRIARTRRRRAGFSDTMMTEDVLHESFLKLSGRTIWQSQKHFLKTASLAMRQVVVDHARRKLTQKHGGGQFAVDLEDAENLLAEFSETPEQIVGIAELLGQLAEENERWLQVVDARYFSGMSEAETAEMLGLSERSVRRDWQQARQWLAAHIKS